MLNTQFNRPAVVLLSAMWALAAALTFLAVAVSLHAGGRAPRVVPPMQTPMQTQLAQAKTVESFTRSTMLRQPGLAISKDKLD